MPSKPTAPFSIVAKVRHTLKTKFFVFLAVATFLLYVRIAAYLVTLFYTTLAETSYRIVAIFLVLIFLSNISAKLFIYIIKNND